MKMGIFHKMALGLILIGVVCLYNACGIPTQFSSNGTASYGTTVGNPMTSTRAVPAVLKAVCQVITQCNPQVTVDACNNGVLATTGIGPALGLVADGADTLSTLLQNEQSSAITANMTSASQCATTISNTTCSAQAVQNAYNASSANPYSGVPGLITSVAPTTCSNVFEKASLIWTFDNVNGNVILDDSGNNNTGTQSNATFVTGITGQALSFNGQSSAVDINTENTTLELKGDLTVSAWVKTGNTVAGYSAIALDYNATAQEYGYILMMDSSGYFSLRIGGNNLNGSSGPSTNFDSSTKAINDNSWHNVVAVMDIANSTISLYVDGSPVLTKNNIPLFAWGSGDKFRIGNQPGNWNTTPWNGSIDEVRVYNRVLSQTEISALAVP